MGQTLLVKRGKETKGNLGLLKFKNFQTNFLTFQSKLHWQLAAPDGLIKDSGANVVAQIHLPQKEIIEGSTVYENYFYNSYHKTLLQESGKFI